MSMVMLHAPILVLELFAVIQLVRFWRSIRRFGYFDPIIRQFYPDFLADCVVWFLFAVQLALACHDWFGLQLGAVGIASESITALTWLTFAAFLVLIGIHCRGRLDHDSAPRTIAALKAMGEPGPRIEL